MKLPPAFASVTVFSKLLAAFLFIFIPFVTFFLGMSYGMKLTDMLYGKAKQGSFQKENVIPLKVRSISGYVPHVNCQYDGWNLSKDFLRSYVVKPGDSLLSIAANQMGSTSRVSELIKFNHDTYSLSLENPILEPGWVLKIPPEFVKESGGDIRMISGELIETQGPYAWRIYSAQAGGDTGPFAPDSDTVMPETPFIKGDCVNLLWDVRPGNSKVLIITRQEEY
ncbi:MAG: hypothetical protein UV73_C0015G0027 [Candidatus Gottesmanbacteria bacterium GW2011_GWA2_43_14]|uniref:LysM domain-containing protein n=1 Tax=Candidatus Gottesmanbacteria bacterium GW2011_GWA2_43_14 TaxID=1618443 RepID=A0A0G1DDI5_9BACT|nr:MAG: hypothetical protein UV73_C0015G0027 [Candidatus Gottesmanbacteria bacterium GW2011_GWA2_43_14]